MNPEELPLRDIHLSADPSGWPPAPGWWLLLILLITASVMFIRWSRNRLKIKRFRNHLIGELNRCKFAFDNNHNSVEFIAEVSVLLRRIVLHFDGRAAAGLYGKAWLDYLHATTTDIDFQSGPALALSEAPYQQIIDIDVPAVYAFCKQWIDRQCYK